MVISEESETSMRISKLDGGGQLRARLGKALTVLETVGLNDLGSLISDVGHVDLVAMPRCISFMSSRLENFEPPPFLAI